MGIHVDETLVVSLFVLSAAMCKNAVLARQPRTVRNSSDCPSVLIYNRIPKTGSTTMNSLIDVLANQNGFFHFDHLVHPSWSQDTRSLKRSHTVEMYGPDDIRHMVEDIKAKRAEHGRVLVDYHGFYLDYSQHGIEDHAYIQTMREPVDRVISHYNYLHHDAEFRAVRPDSIEACLANSSWAMHTARHGDTSLVFDCYDRNWQTRVLCGHHPVCKSVDHLALREARANLLQHEVVLRTEDLAAGVRELERRLPCYFRGASEALASLGPARVTPQAHKAPVGDETRRRLAELNQLDVELYEYVVHRERVRLHR